ncbi:MAG TPA: hypothetical protein VEA59_03225 [Patescibacteria group bacterium]|nr:hypothetical protein [Patescibacteria group bacterium]
MFFLGDGRRYNIAHFQGFGLSVDTVRKVFQGQHQHRFRLTLGFKNCTFFATLSLGHWIAVTAPMYEDSVMLFFDWVN